MKLKENYLRELLKLSVIFGFVLKFERVIYLASTRQWTKSFTAKCVTCSKVERVDKQQDPWPKYKYVKYGCFRNRGTPKSSVLIRFSIINHPFWGIPIFGNTHMFIPNLKDWTLIHPGSTEIPNEETSHQGICLLPRLHAFTCCQQLRVVFKDDGNYNMGWKSPVISRVI